MPPQASRMSKWCAFGTVALVVGVTSLIGMGASIASPPVSVVAYVTTAPLASTAPSATASPTTPPPETTTPPTTAPPSTTPTPTEESIDGGGTNEGGPPDEALGDQSGGVSEDTSVQGTKRGQLPSTGGGISAYLFLALALFLAGAVLTAGTIRRSPKRRY